MPTFIYRQVSHTSDDATIGVIGMNVDASFMQLMLYKHVPECAEEQNRYSKRKGSIHVDLILEVMCKIINL